MEKSTSLVLICLIAATLLNAQTPDKTYGKLFHDVQLARVFSDQKVFVDCIPKKPAAEIVADYLRLSSNPAIRFSLKLFLNENFETPVEPIAPALQEESEPLSYLKKNWQPFKREADKAFAGSSLIPLPFPYIVSTYKSRDINYTDAYYSMIGLKEIGETELIENMVKNCSFLIDSFAHIPNGNRTYWISRSAQPYFSMMVEMLASLKGDLIYTNYLPELEKEYNYWMEDAGKLKNGQSIKRVIKLPDGSLLNRYWDDLEIPRQECYAEDYNLGSKNTEQRAAVIYRDLRAAASSGWNNSSRWLADPNNLNSINTSYIVPIDLNTLLYKLELVIAKAKQISNDYIGANAFRKKSSDRLAAIDKYCWNKSLRFYTDYNFVTKKQSMVVTPAGLFPFCFFAEKPDYMSLLARQVSTTIQNKLLTDGGILNSEIRSGLEWDAPFGNACMQWICVWGMDRCGQKAFARALAEKWIKSSLSVFKNTGKIPEQINLKPDPTKPEEQKEADTAPAHAVLLNLINLYGLPKE